MGMHVSICACIPIGNAKARYVPPKRAILLLCRDTKNFRNITFSKTIRLMLAPRTYDIRCIIFYHMNACAIPRRCHFSSVHSRVMPTLYPFRPTYANYSWLFGWYHAGIITRVILSQYQTFRHNWIRSQRIVRFHDSYKLLYVLWYSSIECADE